MLSASLPLCLPPFLFDQNFVGQVGRWAGLANEEEKFYAVLACQAITH